MLILPDTNVWIRHLNQAPSIVKTKLAACPPSQVALCDVVKVEQTGNSHEPWTGLFIDCVFGIAAGTHPLA
jgi:hypothetical protein